jgi:D-3-phosphoglycerate dehydrogenase
VSRILITCPPMLRMIDAFREEFARRGAQIHCPEVVQTLGEEELLELVPQFEGWIIGDDPATRRVFEAGRRGKLRAAVKWGVGVDNVDREAARSLGLGIAHTPGMFGGEVADLAMAYVVALARGLVAIDRGVRAGDWPKPGGISLAGRTLGLVGLGDIGGSILRRALAAELNVIAYDPAAPSRAGGAGVRRLPWPQAIEECDFLVLACALTAQNRHMLDARTLALVKPGARIVNVARGALIDEQALADALASGRVHSAALDVFEEEPLPTHSRLRRFEQCIFGSHNGSNTVDAVRRASLKAIELMFELLAPE